MFSLFDQNNLIETYFIMVNKTLFILIINISFLILLVESDDQLRESEVLVKKVFAESGDPLDADSVNELMRNALDSILAIQVKIPIEFHLIYTDLEYLMVNGNSSICYTRRLIKFNELENLYGQSFIHLKAFFERGRIKLFGVCRVSVEGAVNDRMSNQVQSEQSASLDVYLRPIDMRSLTQDPNIAKAVLFSLNSDVNNLRKSPDVTWYEFYQTSLRDVQFMQVDMCRPYMIEIIPGLDVIRTFIEHYGESELTSSMSQNTVDNLRRFIFCKQLQGQLFESYLDQLIREKYSTRELHDMIFDSKNATQLPHDTHIILRILSQNSAKDRNSKLLIESIASIVIPSESPSCSMEEMDRVSRLWLSQFGTKFTVLERYVHLYIQYYASKCIIKFGDELESIKDVRLSIKSIDQISETFRMNLLPTEMISLERLKEYLILEFLVVSNKSPSYLLEYIEYKLDIISQECRLFKPLVEPYKLEYLKIFDKFESHWFPQIQRNFLGMKIIRVFVAIQICDQLEQGNITANEIAQFYRASHETDSPMLP